jgi:hypothetical protein
MTFYRDNCFTARRLRRKLVIVVRGGTPKPSVLVWFDSPPIVYNTDSIFGIRTDFAGLEQVRKTICPDLRMKLGLCG